MIETIKNEWWYENGTQIETIENQDYGLTVLHGRKVGDEWEYAIVFWRYMAAHLILTFKDGKVTQKND